MLLTVENLSMTYDKKTLYSNASFRVFKNDKIGIVGQNGVGKSTLIEILGQKVIPDSGEIIFDKNIKVGYLDQYLKVDKKMSIMTYLKSAFKGVLDSAERLEKVNWEMANEIDKDALTKLVNKATSIREELERADFYAMESNIMRVASGLGVTNYGMNTLLGNLSGGQKIKVILAKLLLENPDLIILDEPTNFLDTNHVDWLVKYLKEYKGTFLIVSHNQEFLNDVVNVIFDIEFGKITRYRGNYQDYLIKKAMMMENYERQYTSNQKERAKLEEYIQKNKARASTANMAKSRQKKLDKMEVLERPKNSNTKIYLNFNYQSISSHKFLEVKNLEIGYYASLLPPMSFEIKSGTKLAISGFNGIGKTTLLKTLIGELKPIDGTFSFVEDVKIAYYEQDHNWDNPKETPMQLISNLYPQMCEKEIRSVLARCAITGGLALQPLETLSGGEQSKVKLCLVMLKKANVLILDEPTNHLDASAKESLLESLQKYPGTVIFVSHERDFVDKLATKIFNIEDLLTA